MTNDPTAGEGFELIEPHCFMPPYFEGFERDDADAAEPADRAPRRRRRDAALALSDEARDELARALLRRCGQQDEPALMEFRQLMRPFMEGVVRDVLWPYYPPGKDKSGKDNEELLRFQVRVAINHALQDVWRQASRFRGEPSLPGGKKPQVTTWLYKPVRSAAVKVLKDDGRFAKDKHGESVKIVQAEDVAGHLHDIPNPGCSPLEGLLARERNANVRRCIRQLSFDHQEVLNLVYLHDMSSGDIAELLQIPEGTVRSRLHHARENLRKLLKAEGIEI